MKPYKFNSVQRRAEYQCWANMKQRCQTPSNKSYKDYGGRGIKVCARWDEFEHFYSDMGPRPSPQHSLDRIDNDGHYCKDNCRWADALTQATNRRNNIKIAIDGSTFTLKEFCVRTNQRYAKVRALLASEGSVVTILFSGEKLTQLRLAAHLKQGELAQRSGIGQQMISKYERGACKPKLHSIQRLAKAFDAPLEAFSSGVH